MTLKSDKNRIEWVDFAKGVAMLLVVIAHTMAGGTYGSLVRGLIYSFHMPLFFILSGYTSKSPKSGKDYMKKQWKGIKSLVIPGSLLFFAWICIEVLRGLGSFSDKVYIKGKCLTWLFASASSTVWGETFIAGIGMMWFFFVLFFGKAVFDAVRLVIPFDKQKILIGFVSLIFGAVGVLLGLYNKWLPFSFDVALAIQPFFFMGALLLSVDLSKKTGVKLLVCTIVWLGCLWVTYPKLDDWSYIEVGLRRYSSIVPVAFLGAFAGTLVLCLAGELILSLEKGIFNGKKVAMPLIYIGKNSFYLLCIHVMDQLWDFIWYTEGHQFISAAKRLGCDLVVFAAFMAVYTVIKKIVGKQR